MAHNMDDLPTNYPAKPVQAQLPLLVVEDDAVQSYALSHVLKKQGYNVLAAFDGKQALDMIETLEVCLIISDIDMPTMDGYEMCRQIKKNPQHSHLPVILLTSLTKPQDLIRGLSAKADFFLTKPVVEEYLFRQISLLLSKPPSLDICEENPLDVEIEGIIYQVTASRGQILKLLLATYENALNQNRALLETQFELQVKSQRLQISETNFYELMENSQDGIMVVDNQGFVRFANSATESILHKSVSQITAHLCEFSIVPNTMREISLENFGNHPIIIELHTRETVWEGTGSYMLILRDITQRKRDEQKILEQQQQLLEANKQLEMLAITDGLTGLRNHRAFKEKLEEEWLRSVRFKSPFSLALLDVDKFKQYNDSFGHPAGDVVLKQISSVIRDITRVTDFPARYGGEEFVIILPNTTEQEAIVFGERLRFAIEKADWVHRPVTASIGISTTNEFIEHHAQLVSEADQAMYFSKNHGRNRVTHSTELKKTH